MNFTTMSAGAFAAGVAGIVVATFILQRLRVRHRPVKVVTTLFWRDAVEEARARILTSRFRHPLAWLFIVALCTVLWAGFANPTSEESGATRVTYLVDLSARAAAPSASDRLLEALRDELASTPSEGRRVLAVTDRLVPLLHPGEGLLVFDRRAQWLTPVVAPSTAARAVRLLAGATSGERRFRVAAMRPFTVADEDLNGATLHFLPLDEPGAPNQRGITALGVTAAASGRWDRVDVLMTVAGATLADLEVGVDGTPITGIDSLGEEGVHVARDVAANGGRLQVTVRSNDDLAVDEMAAVILPTRRPVRVTATADIPEAMRVVLASHPAVTVTDSNPDVVVATSAGATSGRPGLVLTGSTAAIVIGAPTANEAVRLRDVLRAVGLDEVGPVNAAEGSTVQIATAVAPRRTVTMSPVLLGERFDLLASRAFPLAVSSMLLWLAEADDIPARFAAGEAVAGATVARVDGSGRTLDPVGAAFVPPVVGTYTADGDTLHASLLDPSLIDGDEAIASFGEVVASGEFAVDPLLVLALLAFVGLLVEWFLFRTQRMP